MAAGERATRLKDDVADVFESTASFAFEAAHLQLIAVLDRLVFRPCRYTEGLDLELLATLLLSDRYQNRYLGGCALETVTWRRTGIVAGQAGADQRIGFGL